MVSPLKGKTRAQIMAQAAARRARLESQRRAKAAAAAKGTSGKKTVKDKTKKVKKGRVR